MKKLFRISEFAALTGLSRRQLIVYDQENILHPASIDPENGYRYYAASQLEAAYIIARLRGAKISLDDIRSYLHARSPERLIQVIEKHEAILDRQIEELLNAKRAMRLRRLRAKRSLAAEPGTVKVMYVSEKNLFLWPCLPKSGDYRRAMPWEFVQDFYEACRARGVPVGFPLGIFVEAGLIQERRWERASGFFCHLPVREYPIHFARPPGLFAVASDFIREGYPEHLYRKLFAFLDGSRYRICGNSYEEHLLHSLNEEQSYLVQVSIPVELRG